MKMAVLLALLSMTMAPPVLAQSKLRPGIRVGNLPAGGTPAAPAGYDDGGRRDPFGSLIVPKIASVHAERTRTGLGSLSMAEVLVKGIVRNGATAVAILEGPDGRSFAARIQDKLLDAVIKSIEPDGIVFLEQTVNKLGISQSRDVRKALRPSSSGGAR